MTDIYILKQKIINSFENKEYKKVIDFFDMYVTNKKFGVYDSLLDNYIISSIKLGLIDQALKSIEFMVDYFPYYYKPNVLVTNYMMCNELDKAEDILLGLEFTGDICFNLAKIYFLRRNYLAAKTLFFHYLRNSDDLKFINKAKKYLVYIDNYFKYGAFCECNYDDFKANGDKLLPGHVIYVKNIINRETSKNDFDEKIGRRQYMVYKIVSNKIYVFPVTTKTHGGGYVIFGQNYPNVGIDRKIKNSLYSLDESNVDKVTDYITPHDYKYIIGDIYKCTCYEKNEALIGENNVFMDDMLSKLNVSINDIIVLYDADTKKRSFNFVVSVNNDSYETISVNTIDYEDYYMISTDVIEVSRRRYILEVIQLDQKTINDICIQINSINALKTAKIIKKLKRCWQIFSILI